MIKLASLTWTHVFTWISDCVDILLQVSYCKYAATVRWQPLFKTLFYCLVLNTFSLLGWKGDPLVELSNALLLNQWLIWWACESVIKIQDAVYKIEDFCYCGITLLMRLLPVIEILFHGLVELYLTVILSQYMHKCRILKMVFIGLCMSPTKWGQMKHRNKLSNSYTIWSFQWHFTFKLKTRNFFMDVVLKMAIDSKIMFYLGWDLVAANEAAC